MTHFDSRILLSGETPANFIAQISDQTLRKLFRIPVRERYRRPGHKYFFQDRRELHRNILLMIVLIYSVTKLDAISRVVFHLPEESRVRQFFGGDFFCVARSHYRKIVGNRQANSRPRKS